MALEDILAAIRSETEAEIGRIEAAAAEDVSSIQNDAERRASAAYEQARSSRDGAAARDTDRIVNHARLDAEREIQTAAERVYREVLERVTAHIAHVRTDDGYRDVFAQLADECRAVLPGGSRLRVDGRDAELAAEVLVDADIAIDPSLETSGGMILVTADGRHVDNTLETRLLRADPYARQLTANLIPGLGGRP